jgi:hypothetical protein
VCVHIYILKIDDIFSFLILKKMGWPWTRRNNARKNLLHNGHHTVNSNGHNNGSRNGHNNASRNGHNNASRNGHHAVYWYKPLSMYREWSTSRKMKKNAKRNAESREAARIASRNQKTKQILNMQEIYQHQQLQFNKNRLAKLQQQHTQNKSS